MNKSVCRKNEIAWHNRKKRSKEQFLNEIYKKGGIAKIYVIDTNPSNPSVKLIALQHPTKHKII